MELVAHYREIHKKLDPYLKKFLSEKRRPDHEVAIREMELSKSVPCNLGSTWIGRSLLLGRGSGKIGAQMELIRHVIENQNPCAEILPPRVQRLNLPHELIEDGHWDIVSHIADQLCRTLSQQTEERVYQDIANRTGIPRHLLFHNGSVITPMDSLNNVRGRLVQHELITEPIPDPIAVYSRNDFRRLFGSSEEFRREYVGQWAGDSDGNGPSLSDDSSE